MLPKAIFFLLSNIAIMQVQAEIPSNTADIVKSTDSDVAPTKPDLFRVTAVDSKDSTYTSYKTPSFKLSQISKGMIEAKVGYFFFTDAKTRKVYNKGGFDGQIAGSYPIYKYLHIYGSLEYLEKSGNTTNCHYKASLWQLPISLGLRPVISLGDHLTYYCTLGPRYFFVNVNTNSPFLPRNQHANGCGGFANTGFLYVFNSRLTFNLFTEYSYKILHFHSRKSETEGQSPQMGGMTFGGGFGYAF